MDSLLHDLRHAVRTLCRSPAFAAAAILTLAIGIGANAAILSVLQRVLLRPAPVEAIDRLAVVWETDRDASTTREPASIPDLGDFRARSRTFARFTAFSPVELNVAASGGDPERIAALAVDEAWFPTLGLPLLAGRAFTPDEDRPGGPRAAIISEALWTRMFARAPDAVGRTVRLDEAEWTVVGIARSGSDFGALQVLGAAAYGRGFADRGGQPRVDAWIPLRPRPDAPRSNHPIIVLGRLADGASHAAAQAELTRIAAELEREHPQENAARGAHVEALAEVVFGDVRATLWVLVAAVALVLLVASVNVANLLLARAADRAREVTVRTALGASLARLVRQFAAEAAVLVGAGLALGTLLAVAAVDLLRALAPATLPRADELRLDPIALLVTSGLAALIALALGVLPSLAARRVDLAGALQANARGAAGGRRQRRMRSALVVTELAMATTLTVGATLLIRSLWTLQQVDPGFDARGVLKAEFQLPASRYPRDFARFPDWPAQQRFATEVLARLAGAPGITAAALATANPMDAGFTSSIRVTGREGEAGAWPEPSVRTVSDGYFATLRVPVRAGRAFEPGDDAAAPPVVLVNESARARFFDGHEPIGARIQLWGRERTVVGVVGNERIKGLAADAPPAVYLPLPQAPTPSAVLVRTAGDPARAAALVRQAVREVDPALALFGVEPLADTIQGTLAQRRFTMLVLAAFAAAALLLAAVGVHGVLSYAVAQRTREIGIRVALGADLATVRRLVLGDGARLTALGVTIGLGGALALSRAMRSLLFGVEAFDGMTFATVATLLAAVALLASWLPARRAARVEPMEVLRGE